MKSRSLMASVLAYPSRRATVMNSVDAIVGSRISSVPSGTADRVFCAKATQIKTASPAFSLQTLFWKRLKRGDYDHPSADIWALMLLEQLASPPGQQYFVHWLPSDVESLFVMTADQDYAPIQALKLKLMHCPRLGDLSSD